MAESSSSKSEFSDPEAGLWAEFCWTPMSGKESPHLQFWNEEPPAALVTALSEVGWGLAGTPETAWPTLGPLIKLPPYPGVQSRSVAYFLSKKGEGRRPTAGEARWAVRMARELLRLFGIPFHRAVLQRKFSEGG